MFLEMLYIIRSGVGELAQHGEHVALAHDDVLFAVQFHFGASVFTVEHLVAGFQYHFFVFRALSHGENFALQGLFLDVDER